MGLTYTIKNQSGQYFITCTVHQWADVFTRREYADILLDSIRFCQQRKGLLVQTLKSHIAYCRYNILKNLSYS